MGKVFGEKVCVSNPLPTSLDASPCRARASRAALPLTRGRLAAYKRFFCVAGLCILLFTTTTASAQTNWVSQFLNRYQPPAIDPASRVTPPVSDAPWRLMVKDGVLPVSVRDVI